MRYGYLNAMHKKAQRRDNNTCAYCCSLTRSFLYVSPSSLSNFHRKKHSLPQGTFFKSALFSATGTFISFIYEEKGQSS